MTKVETAAHKTIQQENGTTNPSTYLKQPEKVLYFLTSDGKTRQREQMVCGMHREAPQHYLNETTMSNDN